MKKLLSMICCIALILGLCACNRVDTENTDTKPTKLPNKTFAPTPPPTPTLSRGELQECLSKSWSKTENVGGYTIHYELEISSDEIIYTFHTLEKSSGGIRFDYEIISGNQIQRHYPDKVYTITFNEEKNVMTISPSISTNEKSENWYLNGFFETEEKDALSDALLNKWTRAGHSNGYYYTYELDFSKDGARYHYSDDTNYSSGGSNLDYKIISDNQIKFLGSEIIYTITFDDAQQTMTMSPAYSSKAESETWYLKSLRLTDDIQEILWKRYETSSNSYAIYDLYFDDTQITYSVFQGGQQSHYDFDYEIISNTQIRNKESGVIHTITLNKAKNIMIISPAISSTAESETFYFLDS